MSELALPCVICGKPLRNAFVEVDNQPHCGTEFVAAGHYGSTIHDPADEGDPLELVANICDTCILRKIDEGVIQSRTDSFSIRQQTMRQTLVEISDGLNASQPIAASAARRAIDEMLFTSGGIVLSRHPVSERERAWVLAQNYRYHGASYGDDEVVDYDALMVEAGWPPEKL